MEPIGTGESDNNATEVIGLELGILGKEVDFSIAVVKGQATLADIVPLARTICTKITDVVVESICREGGRIPCRKGCAACCGPYLVPLSVPEALRLNEEISAAPTNQREPMLRACLLAAHRILNQNISGPDNRAIPGSPGRTESSVELVCEFEAAMSFSLQRSVYHLSAETDGVQGAFCKGFCRRVRRRAEYRRSGSDAGENAKCSCSIGQRL